MARAVRAFNPNVKYVGLDVALEQLDLAKDVLDAAICCDLNKPDEWKQNNLLHADLPADEFDVLIFGDVLEHLYDPEKTLREALRCLKRGGLVIASIPNVQHWSVFVQLVVGSWPREDQGIFDRTHIRWFTLVDMERLLSGAGLIVETRQGRIFEEQRGREFMEFLEPLAEHLGVDPDSLTNAGLPLQYVLTARKGETQVIGS